MTTTQLNEVAEFISNLPDADAAKILAHLKYLESDTTEVLSVKTLKGKIKELIVNQYRIIFFEIKDTRYVVDAFRKKSQRTPKRIIERAQEIYNRVIKLKKN